MKTILQKIKLSIVVFFFLLLPKLTIAQFDVITTTSLFQGGYNVSCNGGMDGRITAVAVGETGPFFYVWSNGATTSEISGLHAGIYTVTVTRFTTPSGGPAPLGGGVGDTLIRTIELLQPNGMSVHLIAHEYGGGTNISEAGGNDGQLRAEITGGTPPYAYLWSNSSAHEEIEGLSQGNYSLTITDATSCIAMAQITLTEPTPLHIVSISGTSFHGYGVSCFGEDDGTIDLNVAGGIPPYTYQWSNGSFTQDQTKLSSGFYMVRIFDANNAEVDGQFSLTQPAVLDLVLTGSTFGDYNIGCHGCSNGSIQSSLSGGVAPFTYNWSSQQTTPNISGVTAGAYTLQITDVNGCATGSDIGMSQPEREDWTMSGNANTNAANQFIGTVDNTDLVFKTNNAERMRIVADGTCYLNGMAGNGSGIVAVDANGKLSKIFFQEPTECESGGLGIWNADGPNLIYTCGQRQVSIGTEIPYPNILLNVNGNTMLGGTVGIGINPTAVNLQSGSTPYKLIVNGKIGAKEVFCSSGNPWPDYVFMKEYPLLSFAELKNYLAINKHLPGISTAEEINKSGLNMGQLLTSSYEKMEELYLYVLELEARVKQLETQQVNK